MDFERISNLIKAKKGIQLMKVGKRAERMVLVEGDLWDENSDLRVERWEREKFRDLS